MTISTHHRSPRKHCLHTPYSEDRGYGPTLMSRLVNLLHSRGNSWRQISRLLGDFAPAYWHQIAYGKRLPSRKAENLVRKYFGFLPKGVRRLDQISTSELREMFKNRETIEV